MSCLGLMSFLLTKQADPSSISVLGNTMAGGLMGSGLGMLGGGIHGYLTAPEEMDPETGQPVKHEFKNAIREAGIGGLAGAAIGAPIGATLGWSNKTQEYRDLLNMANPKQAYNMMHQPVENLNGWDEATKDVDKGIANVNMSNILQGHRL